MHQAQSFEILVFDDEPLIYELLVRIGKQGFPVAAFVNTRSSGVTIDYLDQHPAKSPRLILVDIDLKQVSNGLDLLPRLADRFKGQVPIVILSSSASKLNIKQAYQNGAIAFTKKPDDLLAWKTYAATLKTYWYHTTLLPPSVAL